MPRKRRSTQIDLQDKMRETLNERIAKVVTLGIKDGYVPVSYTHLTLPTIYSV